MVCHGRFFEQQARFCVERFQNRLLSWARHRESDQEIPDCSNFLRLPLPATPGSHALLTVGAAMTTRTGGRINVLVEVLTIPGASQHCIDWRQNRRMALGRGDRLGKKPHAVDVLHPVSLR